MTAGRPYMVGERGPELFVPGRSGGIVPNGQMGGGVTVNQTINLTTGVSQTVRAEVLNMLPQIADAAKGAVLDAKAPWWFLCGGAGVNHGNLISS